MIERRINLKGVGNVRQLGGMISNHKMIRDNTLIRAAHLHRITDEDIKLTHKFNEIIKLNILKIIISLQIK